MLTAAALDSHMLITKTLRLLQRNIRLQMKLIYKQFSDLQTPTTTEMDKTSLINVWKSVDCVCFDVDSTVIIDEGIDELATFLGKGEEVARLTNQAMGGSVTFQESLRQRLDIIRPSMKNIADFNASHPPKLTRGIRKLIDELQFNDVPVYLVSGGFHSIIEPVAKALDIPFSHIYANRIKFYHNGEYAGFDETEPTSRTGGKAVVMKLLKQNHSYKRLVHVGDGATDLEAWPPADGFIGFGGNQVREAVKKGAKWYITEFTELLDVYTGLQ